MRSARYALPFCLAAALFSTMFVLLVKVAMHRDAGVFVYPLDDAYIHLSMSRNFALHGIWGVSLYGFSGASSSPGWTLLLAAIVRLGGVHLLTPLILNFVAALMLLLLANMILSRALPRAGMAYRTGALFAVVLMVPLPGLALLGMEHVLHSLAALALVATAAWVASIPQGISVPKKAGAALLLAAAACGMLRYESCFAVLAAAGLLWLRRHRPLALLVGIAAAIGPAWYGAYSYAHVGMLLPFSVMMKSSADPPVDPLGGLLTSSVSPILLLLAVIFLIGIARRATRPPGDRAPFWSYPRSFLVVVLLTTMMHAVVGPVGWLMRYEAYLYAIGVVALALAVAEELSALSPGEEKGLTGAERWATLAMMVALLPTGIAMVHRAHHGWSDFVASSHDRYVEHLPQALFVSEEMPKATVIANDIGFLSFYASQARILDPLGLGSIEPVQLERRHRKISPEFVARWAALDNAQLAILHTDFPGMEKMIPAGWTLVESWCFPHNVVFQNHVESFYAPDAESAAALRLRLAAFQALAPEVVRYRFPHDGTSPPEPIRGEIARCPGSASTQ